MSQNRWDRIDFPVLLAIADDTRTDRETDLHGLARRFPAFEIDEIARTLEDLYDSGYIDAYFNRGADKILSVHDVRLRERGRRVTRVWPPEQIYEAFLDALDKRLASESDPKARSALQKILDGTVALGRDVGSNVIAGVITRLAGLG
jgi:hypothetical protein